ncbi:Light regulated Lir1 [Macleaya cordata]|uniref:Light regulated Lir1 n=1 Tax=Macleaya cordata TaxID=56857 RepID=A0A200QGM6_MACCD|nr:Light regulated Lir1 [Macleaya cordata]
MNAALCFAPSLPPLTPNKTSFTPSIFTPKLQTTLVSRCSPIKSMAVESSTVDYSSNTSVFPAEACDTVGGEACNAEMYPEVKLEPENKSTTPKTVSDVVDREYLEYNEPKTVFPGEACDDLGGEFCQPEYQKGVY